MTPPPAILAFGEILWDCFAGHECIGGAPFNVAAHAAQCGLGSELYGRVGQDVRGERARAELRRLAVGTEWLQSDPKLPTGWVDVTLDAAGQPRYAIGGNSAWDAIAAPTHDQQERLRDRGFAALVCGTLALRSPVSRSALGNLRAALPAVPVVYDVNLRMPHTPPAVVWETMPGVSVLKVNDDELAQLGKDLRGSAPAAVEFYQEIHEKFGVKILLLTKGAHGCEVFAERESIGAAGLPLATASAVGAGDAFLAGFLSCWLRGESLDRAARRANRLGAWVASQPMAVPEYPKDWEEM
jgi:fructokinase